MERTLRRRLATIATAGVMLALTAGLPARAIAPPDPDRQASLVGRVTDACTGQAIDGAIVALSPTSAQLPPPDPERTNMGGHYLFQDLAAGDYFVGLSADGYQAIGTNPRTVTIGSSIGVQRLDLTLWPPDPC